LVIDLLIDNVGSCSPLAKNPFRKIVPGHCDRVLLGRFFIRPQNIENGVEPVWIPFVMDPKASLLLREGAG
jgi:hypothetical protein